MSKINKKNVSKISKLREKFNKDRKKYEEYLLKELNYNPPALAPKYERFLWYNKTGDESYSCPQILPQYDKLYIKIGDKKL